MGVMCVFVCVLEGYYGKRVRVCMRFELRTGWGRGVYGRVSI